MTSKLWRCHDKRIVVSEKIWCGDELAEILLDREIVASAMPGSAHLADKDKRSRLTGESRCPRAPESRERHCRLTGTPVYSTRTLRVITTHRIIFVVRDHLKQPIDIRMLARIGARVVGVLGV